MEARRKISVSTLFVVAFLGHPSTVVNAQAEPEPIRAVSDTSAASYASPEGPPRCPKPRTGTLSPLTVEQVVDRGRQRLQRKARRGLEMFDRSGYAASADLAEVGSAVALASNEPGAALAAALRAVQLQPRNRRYLLNAAVILTRLGDPRGGLSLAMVAAQRPAPKRSPFGFDATAQLQLARGNALIAAGRYERAIRALRIAVKEPSLSEARKSLATAYQCAGQTARAMRWQIRSAHRSGDMGTTTGGFGEEVPNLPMVVDLTRGRPVPPIRLQLPGTPEAAAANVGWLRQLPSRTSAQLASVDQEATAVAVKLQQEDPETFDRVLLLTSVRLESWSPTLVTLQEAVSDKYLRLVAVHPSHDGWPRCYHYDNWSRFVEAWSEYFAAEQAEASEMHRVMTGLAANFSNPLAVRWLTLRAQHLWLLSTRIDHQPADWAQSIGWTLDSGPDAGTGCGGPPTHLPMDEPIDPVLEEVEPCSRGLKAVRYKVNLGLGEVTASCESLKFDLTFGAGPRHLSWVSAFTSIDYNWRRDTITIFMGSQGRLGWKNALGGAAVSARSGLYVTLSNARGVATDAGWRVQLKGSGGVGTPEGRVEIDAFSDAVDFTFF